MGKISTLTVGLFCSLAVSAFAQEATPPAASVPAPAPSGNIALGNVFYSVCKDAQRRAACSLYLRGIIEGTQIQASATKQPRLFCPPQGASLEQALDLVLKFMTEKPEQR